MPSRFRNSLHQGLCAELAFLLKATQLGARVARPLDHNARYDFIVEHNNRLHRVQVKSVNSERHRAYPINTSTVSFPRYSPGEIDFLAAYIIPLDTWYIIPARAIARTGMIYLRPHRNSRARRFEKYREAWHQLIADVQ